MAERSDKAKDVAAPSTGSRVRRWRWLATGFVLGGLLTGIATLVVLKEHTATEAMAKLRQVALRAIPYLDPRVRDPNLREWESQRSFVRRVGARPESWMGVASPQHPQWLVRPGYNVAPVARGLTMPVNLAFAPRPPESDDDPLLYVNELGGQIKYVTRGGEVVTYVQGLKNFPAKREPDMGQSGASGLTFIPGAFDLLLTTAYRDDRSGLLANKIVRIRSDDGRTVSGIENFFLFEEPTAPAHHIQQIRFTADGKLLVSIGDAENWEFSQKLTRWGGKILRMNPDGSACPDNPFFDPANPAAPQSYVWAWGLRNVFDFDQDAATGMLLAADNGQNIDRLIRIEPGVNYGWNGDNDSTRLNALYTWGPVDNPSPTGVAILRSDVLGSSGDLRLMVGTFGRAPQVRVDDAAIFEFRFDRATGRLRAQPDKLVQHVASRPAAIIGLAEGPDGLYFTECFSDAPTYRPEATLTSGSIWRVYRDESTRDIGPNLSGAQRGASLFERNCVVCHRYRGEGGFEGPELTAAGDVLMQKLHSLGYEAHVRALARAETSFAVENRPRHEAVLATRGRDRVETWLRHHLEEPRFDEPMAKMPSFRLLPVADREAIIAFLMQDVPHRVPDPFE